MNTSRRTQGAWGRWFHRDQRGAEGPEYLAIVGSLLILLVLVGVAFRGGGSDIGSDWICILNKLINSATGKIGYATGDTVVLGGGQLRTYVWDATCGDTGGGTQPPGGGSPPPGGQPPTQSTPPPWANNPNDPRNGYLDQLPNGNWQSPGGLIYRDPANDPIGEDRVDHVLRHTQDMPNRNIHGVFDPASDAFLNIDIAWEMVQNGNPNVIAIQQGSRTVYIVDVGYDVGYIGGRQGAAQGNPRTTQIQIVVENGNEVVTAYPVIYP